MALTSLATLAFLAHGETPASNDYGKTVENGLRALLGATQESSHLSPVDRSLLTWCLAEAYGLTGLPILLDAVRKENALLDTGSPSSWNIFAAHALYLSGADPAAGKRMLSELTTTYAAQADGTLLGQAAQLLLMMWTVGGEQFAPYLERLRRQDPANWRHGTTPLQTAFVLSLALYQVGGKDWQEWNRRFYPDLVERQVQRKTLGWWTPESMGVPDMPEIKGMSADETRVYATSLMLLTLQRPRVPLSYRSPTEDDQQKRDEDDDIHIEIRL
ncbi:MAG: hypothetical protein PHR35_00350 [Kiritimatiellae bacterium]|nr:hypothetical protein [Kiritimatiellia bacterium]